VSPESNRRASSAHVDCQGTLQLPATRVEAMYAPEMLGERPNAPFTVEAE